jgi:hypothetical protein
MKSNNKNLLQNDYQKSVKACVSLLEEITKKIKKHVLAQAKDSKNWGYVGDMQHVKENLEEINTFLK